MSGKMESRLVVGKQADGHSLFWPSRPCPAHSVLPPY